MKSVFTVCIFCVLLVAFTEANFYGKRVSDGAKSLSQIIADMRTPDAYNVLTAEDILKKIDGLLELYKSQAVATKRSEN